jgi:hypothetical protein
MKHVLASASLHDGGGLFTLAWSLVVIPLSLATIFNYRGMAKRQPRRGRDLMSPKWARIFAVIFLAAGLLALSLALHRFAQGGD